MSLANPLCRSGNLSRMDSGTSYARSVHRLKAKSKP